MAEIKKHKIKLREVNRHLVCRLCRGYYVDATTIAECLHSFCRSCIIRYLEKNSFCPICEVQIHKTKPYLNLRLDKALQDVVYKLVPGLYHNEMKRRREFYAKHPEQVPLVTSEQCGLEERLIFSPDDSISLSLEYLESQDYEDVSSRSSESGCDSQEGFSFPQQLGLMKLKNDGRNSRRESQDVQETPSHPKRYLQCPANVNVSHLKKFIRIKYYLSDRMQVDIVHKGVPLPDHYTLMDVAYIYTWKRSAPMRFFYRITEMKKIVKTKEIEVPATKDVKESNSKPKENPEIEKTLETPKEMKEEIEKEKKVEIKKPENRVETMEEKPAGKSLEKPKDSDPSSKIVDDEAKETTKKSNANDVTPSESSKIKANVEKKPGEKPKEKIMIDPNHNKSESVPSKNQEEKIENSTEIKNEVNGNDKEAKKSNVNLLKSFRKEKLLINRDSSNKVQMKNGSGNTLTITTISKREKPLEKPEASVSIEIKTEKKGCEYDFDSNSPPSKIMPLQEFTRSELYKTKQSKKNCMSLEDFKKRMLKENHEDSKKEKGKTIPALFQIGQKTPNGKSERHEEKRTSPTIINIKTEKNDSKPEINVENSPRLTSPKPIKIENRCGEYSIKHADDALKKPEDVKDPQRGDPKETENGKKKEDNFGAIDLSKTETSPKPKNPLENLMELAKRNVDGKSSNSVVEALISVAQKQSFEPLLKIPQFVQGMKTSPTQAANKSSSEDIAAALQYFVNLNADAKMLNSIAQSPACFEMYQQNIDAIRRLKRQNQMSGLDGPQKKQAKLSPSMGEKSRKFSPETKAKSPTKEEMDAAAKLKMERTLSQIQEQADIHQRMAAQFQKNLPGLIHFHNRPPMMFRPSPTSPSKSSQVKNKSSSLSPNSQKLPLNNLGLPPPDPNFFAAQNYNNLINAGLSNKMTYLEMFQKYLSQQDRINQITPTPHNKEPKTSVQSSKQNKPNPSSIGELYFAAHNSPKVSESTPIPASQKT